MAIAIQEESNEPSLSLRLLYFGVAVLVTSLPACKLACCLAGRRRFANVSDIWVAVLSMPRHKGMIAVVTIGSALIVTFAYHCVAYQTVLRYARLLALRRPPNCCWVVRLAHSHVASKAKEEGVRQRQLIRRLVFISCAGIKHCSRCCHFSISLCCCRSGKTRLINTQWHSRSSTIIASFSSVRCLPASTSSNIPTPLSAIPCQWLDPPS